MKRKSWRIVWHRGRALWDDVLFMRAMYIKRSYILHIFIEHHFKFYFIKFYETVYEYRITIFLSMKKKIYILLEYM